MWAVLGLQTAILPVLIKHHCQADGTPETVCGMTVGGGIKSQREVGGQHGRSGILGHGRASRPSEGQARGSEAVGCP